jgi:hypothetical protein
VLDYDPEQAKALLDEAGYRDPDGDGPQPRLALSYKTTSVEFSRLQAAVIQQNLRDVGIELDVRSYEFATLYADILKGNFQMYSLQWVGGALADPDILRRVFHSQQVPPAGFNRGHFSDPDVDRLIEEASDATDYETRRQLYGKVQQLIAQARRAGNCTERSSSSSRKPHRTSACGIARTSRSRSPHSRVSVSPRRAISLFCETSHANPPATMRCCGRAHRFAFRATPRRE